MRIVFFGTPEFAIPPLSALGEAGHELPLVVTQPDRPAGRGRKRLPSPVKAFALDHGLPLAEPQDPNDPSFVERLRALEPDFVVVAAYGRKLGPAILTVPRFECLNIHPSLLPRHRGPAPIPRAILAGDRETGVTIMRMSEEMDAGDIFAQERTAIVPGESAGELSRRLAHLGAELLVATIPAIAQGKLEPKPQDHTAATYAPALEKGDGAIPWERPADFLERFVRAMDPWPRAFTFLMRPGREPLRVVVRRARAAEGPAGEPGRVARAEGESLAVETGEGFLELLEVQPAGKRVMGAADFLRGYRLAPGQRFSSRPEPPSPG